MNKRDGRARGVARPAVAGETTQDLLPLRAARTITEERMRTRGTWMAIIGLAIVMLTVILAVVFREGFGHDLPLAFALPLYGSGFGALYLSCMEYLSRPTRENHLHAIERMRQVERGLLLLVELMPEEMQQRFYRGYASGAQDAAAATGTDGIRRDGGTGEVLRMRPRSHP